MDFDLKEFQRGLSDELNTQWKSVPDGYKSRMKAAASRIAKRRLVAAANKVSGDNNSVATGPDLIVVALEAELKSFGVTEGATLLQALATFVVNAALKLAKA